MKERGEEIHCEKTFKAYAQIPSGRPLLHTAVAWGILILKILHSPLALVLPVESAHNGEWTGR